MADQPQTTHPNPAAGTGSSRRAQEPVLPPRVPEKLLPALEPDDLDPELAGALAAATSLPRSELLPEVRRLVAAHNSGVAASIAACATHSAEVEAMAQQHDDVREALHRKHRALDAERSQWQAEIANLRRVILGRAEWDVIPVKAITEALHIGPGLFEPANGDERPEDASGWLVGELHRLADGLATRGVPLQAGTTPVGSAIDTALTELDRLRSYIEHRDQASSQHGHDRYRRQCNILAAHNGHFWSHEGTLLDCAGILGGQA